MNTRTLLFLIFIAITTTCQAQSPSSTGWSMELQPDDSLIMQDLPSHPLTPAEANEAVKKLIARSSEYASRSETQKRLYALMRALKIEPRMERNSYVRWHLHHCLAEMASQLGSTNLALKHVNIALEIYGSLIKSKVPEEGVNWGQYYAEHGYAAGIYMQAAKYDSALIFYRRSNEIVRRINDLGAIAASLNNIGIWHDLRGNIDSAAWYYNEALGVQDNEARYDRGLRYSIQDNQAQLSARMGNYSEALALYRKNLSIRLEHQPEKETQTLAAIAETLLQLNRLDEAGTYLSRMKEALSHVPKSYISWREKYLSLSMLYYMRIGKTNEALGLHRQVRQLKDSLASVNQKVQEELYESLIAQQLGRMENILELQKMKLAEKEQETKYDLLLIIFISSFSIIAIASLVFYSRRKAALHRKEQELFTAQGRVVEVELRNKQLEGEKLRTALDLKSADLSDLSLYLAQLCNQNDEIFEGLSRARKLPAGEQQTSLKDIAHQLQVKMQTGNKTGIMLRNVERVNNEFYTKLEQQFPGLSKAEIELCGFLKLNMSSSDIAAFKNIAPKSVKMSRYRLRKKLGLSPDADVYSFIQEI